MASIHRAGQGQGRITRSALKLSGQFGWVERSRQNREQVQSGARACLSGHVIPLKYRREESEEPPLFLKSLQMAVIPSKMRTENQSRQGGHGV